MAAGPCVFLFLACGVNAERFRDLLEGGRLPYLAELAASGAWTPTLLSVFPSVSVVGVLPFLTGAPVAANGIAGIRTLRGERARVYCGADCWRVPRDLDRACPTLFERVAGETVAVDTMEARGARHRLWNRMPWGRYLLTRRPADLAAGVTAPLLRLGARGDPPPLSLVFFHAPGYLGHRFGCRRPYDEALTAVDGEIGRVIRWLRRSGQWERSLLVFSADHGLDDTPHRCDVVGALRAAWPTPVQELPSKLPALTRLGRADRDAVVAAVNGNSCVQFYLRGEVRGAARELVAPLLAVPSVDLVAVRCGPQAVEVHSRAGSAVTRRHGRSWSYEPLAGGDPLGWDAVPGTRPLAGGDFHAEAAWREATAAAEYPDALAQLHDLAACDGAGDVIVSARPGWTPWWEPEAGSHGSLRRSHTVVPLVVGGGAGLHALVRGARTTRDVGRGLGEILAP